MFSIFLGATPPTPIPNPTTLTMNTSTTSSVRARAAFALSAVLAACSGGGTAPTPAPPPPPTAAPCTAPAAPTQTRVLACPAGQTGTFVQTQRFDATPGVCAYVDSADTRSATCFPDHGYTWAPLAVGGGGFITGLDLHPDGRTRLARTDTYGAYLWNATADRWEQLVTASRMPPEDRRISAQGVMDVAAAPSDANRFYLFYDNHLYRSDNAGGTWQRTAFPPSTGNDPNDAYRTSRRPLAIDPRNADVVYVGTTVDGLRRTLDGGATWTTVTAVPAGGRTSAGDAGGHSVYFDASGGAAAGRSQVIYADSVGNGIWRSADGGTSWQRIAGTGTTPRSASRASIASDGTLYLSDNAGSAVGNLWRWRGGAWTNIAVSPTTSAQSITVDPGQPQRLYAWDGGGRGYRSLDGGGSWTPLQHPNRRTAAGDAGYLAFTDQDFFTNAEVRFDPVQPGRLWVAQGFGVWKADVTDTTSLVEWRAESRGIEQLVTNDIVSAPGQTVISAHWDQSMFLHESLDAYPARRYPTADFNSTWQMDWTPAQPGFLVANTTSHLFCCVSARSFQAGWSADGGRTWNSFASQPLNAPFSNAGFYNFWNGGIAVAADSPDNIVWMGLGVVNEDRMPQVTFDRGRSWLPIVLPLAPRANETLGFTGAYFLNRKVLAADKVLPGTFYLVNSSFDRTTFSTGLLAGVWRSTDGGRTWQRRFTGQLTNFAVFNARLGAVPGQAGHLFFTPGPLQGDPGIPLRRTTDGGTTWTDVAGTANVRAFGFGKAAPGASYPAIYYAGSYRDTAFGIWRSTDNGATFVQIGGYPAGSLDNVSAVEGDKDVFGRVYLGFGGSGAVYGQPKN